jgi:hypothetical protein
LTRSPQNHRRSLAVVGEHLVAALHDAHRRFQHGAGGVLVVVAGAHPRLLADHALAAHLFHLAVGVGDHPVAGDQARGHVARIVQRDGVGEDVAVVAGLGLIGDEACFDLHVDRVGSFLVHGGIVRLADTHGASLTAHA